MKQKKIHAFILMGTLLLLTACGNTNDRNQQADNVNTEKVQAASEKEGMEKENTEEFSYTMAEFSVRLFAENYTLQKEKENCMLSPISILPVLAMVENGAANQTLQQMQQVLAPDSTQDEFSANLALMHKQLTGEQALTSANSIWINKKAGLKLDTQFKARNEKAFQAELFETDFDEKTAESVNAWVSEKTKERITEVIQQVKESDLLYLINAVAFDAAWEKPYEDGSIGETNFTNASGEEEAAEGMYGEESTYYQGETYTGFSKPYKENYTFLAFLPAENQDIEAVLSEIETSGWKETMEKKEEDIIVYTSLPKFEAEYNTDLIAAFAQMGMTDVFDSQKADLSLMVAGDSSAETLYISEVIHKTYINVDQKGTKAGAVTAAIAAEGAMLAEQSYEVNLNRPFLYMIVEKETQMPAFIGTVNDL